MPLPAPVQRPSLWHHIRKWDDEQGTTGARRLVSGALLVTDRELAHQVMIGSERYREQSAFLRTRSWVPLPGAVRNAAIKGLMSAIAAHERDPESVPTQVFPNGGHVRTQHWGIWWMRELFRRTIAHDRTAGLDSCVDEFVRRKVLGDDIRGRFRRMRPRLRDELHHRAGLEIERSAGAGPHGDLVDVVTWLDIDLPTIERGELYLRLAHSVVSFTGTALEWAVVVAAGNRSFQEDLRAGRDVRSYLLEAQRLYPTAWRLVRTAVTDHDIGQEPVRAGDDIIIATSALHRSTAYWPDAREYAPCRWAERQAGAERAYMPFGRGRGMCPGREVATEVIQQSLRWIFDNHVVTVRRPVRRVPYVRSIVAPPRLRLRVESRAASG